MREYTCASFRRGSFRDYITFNESGRLVYSFDRKTNYDADSSQDRKFCHDKRIEVRENSALNFFELSHLPEGYEVASKT